MSVSFSTDNKLRYLGTEIQMQSIGDGNFFVDCSNENQQNLTEFAKNMQTNLWDLTKKWIYTSRVGKFLNGDERLANMAREKLEEGFTKYVQPSNKRGPWIKWFTVEKTNEVDLNRWNTYTAEYGKTIKLDNSYDSCKRWFFSSRIGKYLGGNLYLHHLTVKELIKSGDLENYLCERGGHKGLCFNKWTVERLRETS